MSGTPIWDQTVRAIHIDPEEPLEMWRAYLDLRFLPISVIADPLRGFRGTVPGRPSSWSVIRRESE